MKTNHRHYILLSFALLTLVLASAGYGMAYRAIKLQAVRAQEAAKEINTADERKQREFEATALHTKTAADRARLESFIVPSEGIVNLIETIEKIGKDVNAPIELSAIGSEPVAGNSGLSYFKARLKASGSWASVLRALTILENMPHGVTLRNVEVAQSTEPAATPSTVRAPKVWDLSLEIRVLTRKEIKK